MVLQELVSRRTRRSPASSHLQGGRREQFVPPRLRRSHEISGGVCGDSRAPTSGAPSLSAPNSFSPQSFCRSAPSHQVRAKETKAALLMQRVMRGKATRNDLFAAVEYSQTGEPVGRQPPLNPLLSAHLSAHLSLTPPHLLTSSPPHLSHPCILTSSPLHPLTPSPPPLRPISL